MSKLLNNWNISRIIRLVLGIGFAIYATIAKEYILYMLAGFFILQAALNVSCCGSGGCNTSNQTDEAQVYKDQIKQLKP